MDKIKICLDAGHYGKYNQSEIEPAFFESDFNWKHHLLLKKYLEEFGIEVTLTRSDKNRDMDLYERGRSAKGCDLFLSCHANWAERRTADYPVAYVPINGSGDELGLKLAKCIAEVMGTIESGEIQSKKSTNGLWDWYGVIYGAASVGVTGIILEHSFYSNERSVKWLMVEGNVDRLARAEAEVIALHYDIDKPAPKEIYRVISGAYVIRKNADDKLAKVRTRYPDAIMIRAGEYFKIQIEAFAAPEPARALLSEVKGNLLDGYISTDTDVEIIVGNEKPVSYNREMFIRELQEAIGADIDGLAGPQTLSKAPTLSRWVNADHPAVRPVQKWLYDLGYVEIGEADGIAGAKFEKAVLRYQREHDCVDDGEITKGNKTWRKLLGME